MSSQLGLQRPELWRPVPLNTPRVPSDGRHCACPPQPPWLGYARGGDLSPTTLAVVCNSERTYMRSFFSLFFFKKSDGHGLLQDSRALWWRLLRAAFLPGRDTRAVRGVSPLSARVCSATSFQFDLSLLPVELVSLDSKATNFHNLNSNSNIKINISINQYLEYYTHTELMGL